MGQELFLVARSRKRIYRCNNSQQSIDVDICEMDQ
uniref:Transposase n=1 Tax=Ascaris lumbricoides TaxID=6252 RepID=A0A0M3HH73_ASCLU